MKKIYFNQFKVLIIFFLETKVEKNIIAYVGNATIATPVSINMDSNRKLVKKYTPEKLFEYPLDFRFQVFQHDNDTELEYYGYVWVENIKCNWICDQAGSECSKVYCWNQPKFCNDNKQCFKRKDLCEDFDNKESGVLTNALEIEEFWVDKKPWFLLGSDWKCDRFGNDFFCKNYEYKEVLYYPSSLLKTLGG